MWQDILTKERDCFPLLLDSKGAYCKPCTAPFYVKCYLKLLGKKHPNTTQNYMVVFTMAFVVSILHTDAVVHEKCQR